MEWEQITPLDWTHFSSQVTILSRKDLVVRLLINDEQSATLWAKAEKLSNDEKPINYVHEGVLSSMCNLYWTVLLILVQFAVDFY